MKRQRKRCKLCYYYVPHSHLERLKNAPPKTNPGEFIFFPSCSDWAFIPKDVGDEAIAYMKRYPDRLFLCQTKDPSCFYRYTFPENAILDITLETNQPNLTQAISKAPVPEYRYRLLKQYPHPLKMITIEPILAFNLDVLVSWILEIKPWRVYLGYDSHPKINKLIEPPLREFDTIYEKLKERRIDVRIKLRRKAWWEK